MIIWNVNKFASNAMQPRLLTEEHATQRKDLHGRNGYILLTALILNHVIAMCLVLWKRQWYHNDGEVQMQCGNGYETLDRNFSAISPKNSCYGTRILLK